MSTTLDSVATQYTLTTALLGLQGPVVDNTSDGSTTFRYRNPIPEQIHGNGKVHETQSNEIHVMTVDHHGDEDEVLRKAIDGVVMVVARMVSFDKETEYVVELARLRAKYLPSQPAA